MSRRREERGRRAKFTSESECDEITIPDAIQDFTQDKRPSTVANYKHRINHFLRWLRANYQRDGFRARRKHIVAYLAMVKVRAPASQRSCLTILRSFYKYLYNQRLVSSNCCATVPIPKPHGRRIPREMTKHQLKYLLEVSKQRKHRRVRPMLLCAVYGSLRRFEIQKLQKNHLRKVQNGPRARFELYVKDGKGAKSRTIRIPGWTYREIEKQKRLKPKSVWLFPNRKGRPFALSTIHSRFKKLLIDAGLPGHASHSCRHCFATFSLAGGAQLTAVSKAMGHSSVGTTSLYLHDTSSAAPASFIKL